MGGGAVWLLKKGLVLPLPDDAAGGEATAPPSFMRRLKGLVLDLSAAGLVVTATGGAGGGVGAAMTGGGVAGFGV